MNLFDPLLDRATRRLAGDAELQLEVRNELHGHLVDAAAERTAAGDADPAAAAITALGDPDKLADQLYIANRHRLRVRQAVRWTIGAGIVPAMAVAAVAIAWGPILSLAVVISMASGWIPHFERNRAGPIASTISHWMLQRFEARLSPRARHLATMTAFGDYDWPQRTAAALNALAAWTKADPHNPIARATYAQHLVGAMWRNHDGKLMPPSPSIKQVLGVLKGDEQAQPANGLYPLLQSEVLFDESVDWGASNIWKHQTAIERRLQSFYFGKIDVSDPTRFHTALAALHRAAHCPIYLTYQPALADALAQAIPLTGNFGNLLIRDDLLQEVEWSQPLASTAATWAGQQAETGDIAAAKSVASDLRALAQLIVSSSNDGRAVQRATQFATDGDNIQAIIAHREGNLGEFNRLADRAEATYGAAGAVMRASHLNANARLKRSMVTQAAAGGWLILLMVVVVLSIAPALGVRVASGRWPAALNLGWHGVACGAVAAIPAIIYGLWKWAGGPSPHTKWWFNDTRLDLELAFVAAVGMALLRWGTIRAVRRRAVALNLLELSSTRFGLPRMLIGIVLVAASVAVWIGFGFNWWFSYDAYWISFALTLYAIDTAMLPIASPAPPARSLLMIMRIIVGLLLTIGFGDHTVDWWWYPYWIYPGTILAIIMGVVLVACLVNFIRDVLRQRRQPPTPQRRFSMAWTALPAMATAAMAVVLCIALPAHLSQRHSLSSAIKSASSITGPNSAVAALQHQIMAEPPNNAAHKI